MTDKKYRVIAKVGNDKFVRYKVNNLILFAAFLDRQFPSWRFFNVYQYTKNGDGCQLASYTNRNRPKSRFV
jgi:hypothetical protein